MWSIFTSKNLTAKTNKIAFNCRELKNNGRIDEEYSRDSVSKDIGNGKKIKSWTWTLYMAGFQILISEKMHEKIITIHCNQAMSRCSFKMVLSYYIQKQHLRGALGKRYFKICFQSTWQIPMCLILVRLQAVSLQPYWKRGFSWVFFNDFDCGFQLATFH